MPGAYMHIIISICLFLSLSLSLSLSLALSLRTGYVVPAAFMIKKSVKPLTTVEAFEFKTSVRAQGLS